MKDDGASPPGCPPEPVGSGGSSCARARSTSDSSVRTFRRVVGTGHPERSRCHAARTPPSPTTGEAHTASKTLDSSCHAAAVAQRTLQRSRGERVATLTAWKFSTTHGADSAEYTMHDLERQGHVTVH